MWAENINDCKDPSDYAYCTCAVYSCGYSQPNRKNISENRLISGTAECDCSSGVSWWLFKGGYLDECPWFYTAIEREYLKEHGFEMFRFGTRDPERNDVLWKSGHTGLYIGEWLQAEAIRTERHDAGWDGSTAGDQDGGETVVRPLTDDWEYVLRKIDKPEQRRGQGADEMICLIQPNEDGILWYIDGANVHPLAHPDEATAIRDIYRKTHDGEEIPEFVYGSPDAPWATRLKDALCRKM